MFGAGLTPAYAGNTKSRSSPRHRLWAHPRIRGEYQTISPSLTCQTGSPPHTRGIHIQKAVLEFHLRLTPAYAGNTLYATVRQTGPGAHPRIRGEYGLSHFYHLWSVGSPPHTRGILISLQIQIPACRLTPAYAGNTYVGYKHSQCDWAHPRIRGEYARLR